MPDVLIQTLETNQGKNPGEAIASYGRSIVFLPKGTEPNKRVRVKLYELDKKDSRGRTMYRAVPADDEYTERWKDNGNGTASRVTIATSWLLQENEVGTVETRPLGKREGTPSTQSKLLVVWGKDLASSVIENSQVNLIPLEEEKVENGQLVWRKTSERQEAGSSVSYPISRIAVGNCEWQRSCLQPTYNSGWLVQVTLCYQPPELTMEQSCSLQSTWAEMPVWWQQEQENRYPVCGCGRQRHDMQVADAYTKCELCRAEETCVRCNKKASIKNLSGHLVCAACQPYEMAEQLIKKLLPHEHREVFAAEATKLLAGRAMVQAEGETILKSTLDHITDTWNRSNLTQKYAGYGWYYFCNEGVYGTKLAPGALTILQFLPQATGNGLVEMVSWLCFGPKPSTRDFYLQTQVDGNPATPSVDESMLKALIDGTWKVGDWLRGSEADRVTALAGYQNLIEKLGKETDQVKAVAEILQNEKQDYAAALSKIHEADSLLSAIDHGEVMFNLAGHFRHMGENDQCDIWVINSDGVEAEPVINYRKRHSSEGDKQWQVVGPDDLILKWVRWQEGGEFHESWEVVKLPMNTLANMQVQGARRVEPHERFSGPGSGFNLSRVGMNKCSISRDLGYDKFWVTSYGAQPVPCDENGEPINPEALLAKQLQAAKENFESNQVFAEEQVAQGSWLRLKFRKGKHPKTGELQWEAGNKQIKYVLDRFTGYEPVEGQTYYCSLGKLLVDLPTFRLQVACLERPFPEDAPIAGETVSQPGEKLTPEQLAALKSKWGVKTTSGLRANRGKITGGAENP